MKNADTFAAVRPSDRLMRGIAVASRAHDGHYRKGSGVPYISHPMAVMLIAASMTNDENVLLATLSVYSEPATVVVHECPQRGC